MSNGVWPGSTTAGSTMEARASDVPGVVEVLRAHIRAWGYPPHSHDTWAVLVVDEGAIDYRLDRRRYEAAPGTVTVLPPGITHDGRPVRGELGFRKRELYLTADFLPPGLRGPAVDHTNLRDPALAIAVRRLHTTLSSREPGLEAEDHLARLATRIGSHLSARARLTRPPVPERAVARRLRDLLDDGLPHPPALAEAAARLERSVPHLVRSFTAEFGLSPHAYVIARRIDRARGALLRGDRPAQVAADLGFHDQAHFTRHFRRHTSTTPGRFVAALG